MRPRADIGVRLLGAGLALSCTGCAAAPSVLHPAGAPADRLSLLSWILIAAAAAVFVATTALLLWPVLRESRRRAGDRPAGDGGRPGGRGELSPLPAEEGRDAPSRMIVVGSLVSGVILAALFGLTVIELDAVSGERDGADLVVEIVGHRWWWEVRYPDAPGAAGGEPVVTANEIHVPVGRRVRVRVSTADVIHSFWVPRLTGKIDLVPGKVNETWLRADEAGVYHGACAEYCGLQHANMMLQVVAEPPERFRRWLLRQARPAQPPASDLARQGMRVVTGGACGGCHTIRGTQARGEAGPDLTHFAGRDRLAAGMFPNERGYLAAWVVDAQSLKPGVLMPSVDEYGGRTLRAVVAYLESLE